MLFRSLGDIEEALAIVRAGGAADRPPERIHPLHLLHCVTAYPTPAEEYNLRLLVSLRQIFAVATGVSDHSRDPRLIPAVATALGASMIEKHITLARDGEGLDDAVSLEPGEFAELVTQVRRGAEQRASAATTETMLRELSGEFGEERVTAVLGDGVKRLAASERESYGRSNRSILAREHIPAGSLLDGSNMAVLRSERELQPGLPPRLWDTIAGRRTLGDIQAGDGVRWEHLLQD